MKTVVAVLRGGPTPYYETSLESGADILAALSPAKYEGRDIFIDHEGFWHLGGSAVMPERALRGTHLVFNCIHGRYGRDGWLHQLLQKLGHRHVGSLPGPLALAYNKERSKQIAERLGIQVPAHKALSHAIDIDVLAHHMASTFPLPAIVKPIGGSMSFGLSMATDLSSMRSGMEQAFSHAPKILVEELIAGTEASAGVLEGWQGEPHYTFVRGELSTAERRVLMVLARKLHEALGLRHYSMSDFIINSRGVWYLETNALPELNSYGRFARGLQEEGIAAPEFVEHVIALAQK